ncbi:AbfB domain-containing protein [Deinococcus sp.]|uniref:AbfB domain-containing protein n=1 Tax=Deinococcus sp. TaxID=47478 RepID=UPI003B5967E8
MIEFRHRRLLGLSAALLLSACTQDAARPTAQTATSTLDAQALASCAPVTLDPAALYKLTARHSGKALEVAGSKTENGALTGQYDYLGQANQQWQLGAVEGGFFKLIAKHSGRALDVSEISQNSGAALHQWDYVGGDNQKWCPVPTDSGYFKLIAKHSGKAAEVENASQANGAVVRQQDVSSAPAQQWKFEVIGTTPPPNPPSSSLLKVGTTSLRTVTPGITNRYISQSASLGVTAAVTASSSDALKADSTWKVVAGLDDPNCFSFESYNQAGKFLRHFNSRLRLDQNDNSPQLKTDATFCAVKGLDGGNTVSLAAKNYPGSYLRHRNAEMWLDPAKTDAIYKADASWAVSAPWATGTVNPPPPPPPPVNPPTNPGTPGTVNKTNKTKVYVHYMPWFETQDAKGVWGQHWTMKNENPNIVDASGKRQIAAHYYPLTGPYASSDPDIIEYQLLLMKLSGIDGVLIDWPGTTNLYDYPRNKSNSEALIARLGKVGLTFGIIYEDQNINIAVGQGVVTDKIGQARADMNYLRDNYFPNGSYIKVNGKPLLGDFGPQTFHSPGEWQQIFSGLSNKPCFLTLWDSHDQAAGSSDCTGEFSWVVSQNTTQLANFYNFRPNFGVKIGSVYPGFDDFYAEGGWGNTLFKIPANGTQTFNQTLDLALNAKIDAIQLVTWNDYGEGTMIEPTREFGYSLLTTLQQRLGVPYGQSDLELVSKLLSQRRQYKGNAAEQSRLDQAAAALAALNISQASTLLK